MRLNTQTASLVNHLYSRATIGQPVPVVGMGCTLLSWTDRHAGTIQKVTELSGNWQYEIEVTQDDARVISGSCHDGSAQYEFVPCPDNHVSKFRFSKKTQEWTAGFVNPETGKWNNYKSGNGLRIGEREEYFDPSF